MAADIKILIVDDDIVQCRLYQSFLELLGRALDCTCCTTVASALTAYRQTYYPLIITDLDIPDMDGIAFCRQIRSLPQGTHSKIVMISGNENSEDIQRAREAGVDEYLLKPVDLECFLIIIRMYLP